MVPLDKFIIFVSNIHKKATDRNQFVFSKTWFLNFWIFYWMEYFWLFVYMNLLYREVQKNQLGTEVSYIICSGPSISKLWIYLSGAKEKFVITIDPKIDTVISNFWRCVILVSWTSWSDETGKARNIVSYSILFFQRFLCKIHQI